MAPPAACGTPLASVSLFSQAARRGRRPARPPSATTAAAALGARAEPPQPQRLSIQRGDTLRSLAHRAGVSVEQLVAANPALRRDVRFQTEAAFFDAEERRGPWGQLAQSIARAVQAPPPSDEGPLAAAAKRQGVSVGQLLVMYPSIRHDPRYSAELRELLQGAGAAEPAANPPLPRARTAEKPLSDKLRSLWQEQRAATGRQQPASAAAHGANKKQASGQQPPAAATKGTLAPRMQPPPGRRAGQQQQQQQPSPPPVWTAAASAAVPASVAAALAIVGMGVGLRRAYAAAAAVPAAASLEAGMVSASAAGTTLGRALQLAAPDAPLLFATLVLLLLNTACFLAVPLSIGHVFDVIRAGRPDALPMAAAVLAAALGVPGLVGAAQVRRREKKRGAGRGALALLYPHDLALQPAVFP